MEKNIETSSMKAVKLVFDIVLDVVERSIDLDESDVMDLCDKMNKWMVRRCKSKEIVNMMSGKHMPFKPNELLEIAACSIVKSTAK